MTDSASSDRRNYILPRSRILRGRDPIQRLFRAGRVVKDQNMDLRYLLIPDQPGVCLMGFIVGKRLGKANQRNVIKRRMRESYRLHQYMIRDVVESENFGFHGIFIAKKIDSPFAAIDLECKRLLAAIRSKLTREA